MATTCLLAFYGGCGSESDPTRMAPIGPGTGSGAAGGATGSGGNNGGMIGTGGSPADGGGGGTALSEDCYDGIDTDENGTTDCIDPDPACAAVCADPCTAPKVLSDPDSTSSSNESWGIVEGASCADPNGAGPTAVFEVTASQTGVLQVDVDTSVPEDNVTVSVRTTCSDDSSEIVCAEDVSGDVPPNVERAKVAVTAGDTVYVLVQGYASTDEGAFFIRVQSYVPLCGDGKVDPPETCDDGQMTPTSGDGCSDQCQFEPTEGGNNDTPPGDAYTDPYFGEINPHSDIDVVSVNIPGPNYSMRAETFDLGDGACAGAQIDSYISILDPSQTELASDDDSGDTYCATVEARDLSAGNHYVQVAAAAKSDMNHTFIYYLYIDIDECGNGMLGGAEECDLGDLMNGDGCSDQCLIE